jgi:hypothetical protein
MGCGKSKPDQLLHEPKVPEITPSTPTERAPIQSVTEPASKPSPNVVTKQTIEVSQNVENQTDTQYVSNVVVSLKLHAAECLQASVRRRNSMLALKEMGHISSLYVFETISRESMDGSISPRTVEALYKCEVFKNVPPDVLPAVVNNSKRKHYEAGDRVVVAGERSESMFIVCSGHLVCEVNGIEVRPPSSPSTAQHNPIHNTAPCTTPSASQAKPPPLVSPRSGAYWAAGRASGRWRSSRTAPGTSTRSTPSSSATPPPSRACASFPSSPLTNMI